MRASNLFMLASLFLLGSYSLPQPESMEPSRTIEDREANFHGGGAGGWEHHRKGPSESTNDTKIKERQGPPEGMTWMEFMKHKKHHGDHVSQASFVPMSTGTSTTIGEVSPGGNSTKAKMMKFRD